MKERESVVSFTYGFSSLRTVLSSLNPKYERLTLFKKSITTYPDTKCRLLNRRIQLLTKSRVSSENPLLFIL